MFELELPTNLNPISKRPNYSCEVEEEYDILTCCHPVSDKTELEETFTVSIVAHSYSGDTEVFKAVITSQQNPDYRLKAACKVAYGVDRGQQLVHESTLYAGKLKDLQGVYIPRYYGLYCGATKDGTFTTVMVLQDGGRALWRPLYETPEYFRRRAIEALLHIHRAGVHHRDFAERNIVVQKKDGEDTYWPMIIDFGEAKEHNCQRKEEVEFFTKVDRGGIDHCDEIYYACRETAEVWIPDKMWFSGGTVPAEFADGDEQALIKRGALGLRPDLSEEQKLEIARKAIREHHERLEQWKQWGEGPALFK